MNDKLESFIKLMNVYQREKYFVFAGAEWLESVYEDEQIVTDEIICPGGGDFIVWDRRCLKGTYGVGSYGEIAPVKVKKPTSHGISYRKKPIDRIIGTDLLIRRYFWIDDLFINWLHRETPSIFNAFKNFEEINVAYKNEKECLYNDPWLAMYWLLHFGFCFDSRLQEVIDLIESEEFDRSIDETLNRYIEKAIFFFKNSESDYSFVIKNNHGEESDDLFLNRRSYLIYQTQLYRYASGDDFNAWWKCFSIFPKVNNNFIYKLRWLKNNVNKYNRWGEFYNKFKTYSNIPLLSYIAACDPNLSDREIHASNFLSELIENRKYFNGDKQKDFVRAMLYDLKDLNFDSDELYFELCEHYFNKNLTSPEYIEILKCRGVYNEDNVEAADLSSGLRKTLNDNVHGNEIFD